MTAAFIFFLISLVVVIFGARLFINTSISLSKLLHFPEMVVGATLVALATTMPETLVSLFASITGHTALALGNVVGSGLVNLGFLLGFIFLSGKHEGAKGRGKRRSLILFGLIFFVYLWFLFFGKIGFLGGMILISLAFLFLVYTFHYALVESGEKLIVIEEKLEDHLRTLLKFVFGGLLLILGARFLVQSAVDLAGFFALPELVIGLTIVAIGTSLPELVTAVTALVSGHEQISMGNLTGATVITFTFALGLAAVLKEITIPASVLRFEFVLLLFFSGLNVLYAFFPRIPQRFLGGFLLGGFIFYLFSLF